VDTITVLDFAFGVVTTLFLGAITVVQFRAERLRQRAEEKTTARQRSFEDTQFALDIQASTSSAEIVELLAKTPLSSRETEFLKQTHEIAQARLDAMSKFTELDESLKKNVEQALQRLVDVIGDDPEVQARQAAINTRYGTTVQTDRSNFSWNGKGKFSKYEVLHLIAQKFIADNKITTRDEFDKKFGGVVTSVLGDQVSGKTFASNRLLDPLAQEGRYAPRDLKLADSLGAIHFDGVDHRAGWTLGYAGVPDIGRAVQRPVIEHFTTQPGYDLRAV